jgi:hypothetical protein
MKRTSVEFLQLIWSIWLWRNLKTHNVRLYTSFPSLVACWLPVGCLLVVCWLLSMVIDTCYLTMIVVGWESDTEFTMSRQNISMSLDMCLP